MENDVLYFIRIYITYNSRYIVGVDINDGKFPLAQQMGAHECVNEGGDVKADGQGEVGLRLHLQLHRQRQCDALRSRGGSPWVGQVLCHRGGGCWEGDLNQTFPAGHRQELKGNCIWGMEVEDGGAQAGADCHEGGDGLGALHHPHIQGVGSGETVKKDPKRCLLPSSGECFHRCSAQWGMSEGYRQHWRE